MHVSYISKCLHNGHRVTLRIGFHIFFFIDITKHQNYTSVRIHICLYKDHSTNNYMVTFGKGKCDL